MVDRKGCRVEIKHHLDEQVVSAIAWPCQRTRLLPT
jgi:hypothetical protein